MHEIVFPEKKCGHRWHMLKASNSDKEVYECLHCHLTCEWDRHSLQGKFVTENGAEVGRTYEHPLAYVR